MAESEQKRLDVETTLNASGFVTGAKQIETSSKAAGEAAVRLSDKVRQAGDTAGDAAPKLSRTGDSVEKLKRSLIDGYAATQRAEQAINGVAKAMAAGDLAGEQLAMSIDGIIRRYGVLASESVAATKGTLQNAAAVSVLNQRLKEQKSLGPGGVNDNDRNGGFRRQNLGYQAFDVGQGLAGGMPIGLILAQQGPQIAQLYAQAGGAKALAEDAKAVMGGVASVARAAFAAIGPVGLAFGAVSLAAGAFYLLSRESAKTTDEVLKEHAANIKALGDAYGIAEEKARSYSVADKALAEAASRSSGEELLAKRAEAIEDLSFSFGQIGVGGKGGTPNFQMAGGLREFQKAFDELRKNADVPKFIASVDAIGNSPGMERFADKILNAAKQLGLINDALVETARLTNAISGASQRGFLVNDQSARNAFEDGLTDTYLRQQKVLDTLKQSQAQFDAQRLQMAAKSPQEKANAARASAEATVDPNENADVRAQRIELASKQALTAAEYELSEAKASRERSSANALAAAQNELSLIGKTVQEQARLRAEYEATATIREAAAQAGVAADEKEIAAAKAKAAQIAQINQQVAAGKLLQDQGYQIEQLQLEANLIGASAQERTRATAALQAEQQLRQQGIDLLSREGEQYKANAVAMAEARLQIERQNAAYTSAQQAGGSMIDAMLAGTGSLKERFHGLAETGLKWVAELGANSVKNSLTGTNLPTLGDLFSGKPAVPGGGTSTGVMTVTAGVVNVAGAGGIPGLSVASPAAGLAGLLGYKPTATGAAPVIPVERAPLESIFNKQAGYVPPYEAGSTQGGIPLSTITTPNGLTANVNAKYAGNFQGFTNELSASGYDINSIGGYNYRNIDGTNKLSNHAFGDAIDINPGQNPVTYGSKTTNMPSNVSEMAGKYGLEWGGDWKNKKDPMHFEVAKGAQPIDQTNAAMSKLTATTNSAAKDIGGLGDSSLDAGKSLADSLGGANSALTKVPTPTAAGMFPPAPAAAAPAGGGGFLSLFSGLFSLFGFADGTDFSPGGMAIVGERGPELVNLPRGSHVTPNHKMSQSGKSGGGQKSGPVISISVSGSGDKDLMDRLNIAAEEAAVRLITSYDRDALPGRMKQISDDEYARG